MDLLSDLFASVKVYKHINSSAPGQKGGKIVADYFEFNIAKENRLVNFNNCNNGIWVPSQCKDGLAMYEFPL